MTINLTKTTNRRTLTWFGHAVLSTIILLLCGAFILNLYPFLAKNRPPADGIMVIEGWIQDYALEEALVLYRTGNYEKIATTGVQIETGQLLCEWKTYSEMTTARLIELGIPAEEIITTSDIAAQRDRTYVAALALKKQLAAQNIPQKNLHLISVGPHGRRSLLLFKKALGEKYNIGVTCLEDQSYDADYWWKSSNGFRTVTDEFIAYLYAVLLFRP